jgi:hypothetical protein
VWELAKERLRIPKRLGGLGLTDVELYPVGLGPAEAPRVSRCLSFTEKRPGWNLKDARRAKGLNRDGARVN